MALCSVDGCKRAVACLCRHCDKDVCSKHFNEHQIEVNNELIPIADRLNECRKFILKNFVSFSFILVKMRIRFDDKTGPLRMLQTWKERKHREIDGEYNRKVEEFKKNIWKYDEQISKLILNIEELMNEGDVSIDHVKQIQKTIENLTNQINNLKINEPIDDISNLLDTYIQMGGIRYLVKAKIKCNNTELYAIESERALVGYDGLCPECNKLHVVFERNRGFYALCKTLQNKIVNQE
jgi:hypothetical protein